ncbi:MAG: hypothetical protein WAL75_19380 [Terracidiphilus sp.]
MGDFWSPILLSSFSLTGIVQRNNREIAMGYDDRLYVTACKKCGTRWLFSPKAEGNDPAVPKHMFVCDSCTAQNYFRNPEMYPNLPPELFLGHEKHHQVRILPFPLEQRTSSWAYPYSIRSVLYQLSRELGECFLRVGGPNLVFGEKLFSDNCYDSPDPDVWDEGHICHITSGFTRDAETCPLFEKIKGLCQTPHEQRFLWAYLQIAKTRNFPMLLPQPRIGVGGRRRPDFVVFVPKQFLVYKRYAVELDGAHTNVDADQARDSDLAAEDYEVISVRPGDKGYFLEVRTLIERFYAEMTESKESEWELATEITVSHHTGGTSITDEDIPF